MKGIELIIQPLLVGLSSGVFCGMYCFPFIAPILISEKRKLSQDFILLLKFIFGRLLGYIAFGALFGYLGEKITQDKFDLIASIVLIVLSAILVLYTLGFIKKKRSFCLKPKIKTKLPILMGFLMGINVCPPFLMSLVYVFKLHNVLYGVIYFLIFFLATTIYFIPLGFLGYFNKFKEFQAVGRISALIVGVSFFVYGIYDIIRYFYD
ncbi:sulfite exporter TauE/SafE family protein [bacterium]|nr:sulfite exporter TauE/SafE family protein [bacterium]